MTTITASTFLRPHLRRNPITLDLSIEPDESLGTLQEYDSLTGRYSPDYSVVPLTLSVRARVTDHNLRPDESQPTVEESTARLTDIQWFEIDGDGNDRNIDLTSSSTIYAHPSDGDKKTLLVIGNTPVTGRAIGVEATYRDGEVIRRRATIALRVDSVAPPVPRLSLDVPGVFRYNPITDRRETHTVTATMFQAGAEVPSSMRRLVWEALRPSSKLWEPIDTAEVEDCEFNLNADGSQLSMTLALVQDGTRLRCRGAWKRSDGTWAGALNAEPTADPTTESSAPEAEFEISRKCRRLGIQIVNLCTDISSQEVVAHPRVIVTEGSRVVENPGEVLDIVWKAGKANGEGSVTPTATLGTGERCTVPASYLDPSFGMVVLVTVSLKGESAVQMDENGNILTDEAGAYLIV